MKNRKNNKVKLTGRIISDLEFNHEVSMSKVGVVEE